MRAVCCTHLKKIVSLLGEDYQWQGGQLRPGRGRLLQLQVSTILFHQLFHCISTKICILLICSCFCKGEGDDTEAEGVRVEMEEEMNGHSRGEANKAVDET